LTAATVKPLTSFDDEAVARLRREPLGPGVKGLPVEAGAELTVEAVSNAGWNVLAGDLPLPLMVLRESAMAGNIETMASYCGRRDLLLAPHGKTTMAPQLFQRQIRAGCWALTAATPTHLALYRAFGIGRILYANQLVERSTLRWLVRKLSEDPSFDFYCFVDSRQGVGRMASILENEPPVDPINVLVEVGHPSGRTGCRTTGEACDVAKAVQRCPSLRLAGVSAFEGTLRGGSATEAASPDAVVTFLDTVASAARALGEEGISTAVVRQPWCQPAEAHTSTSSSRSWAR
jgi:D-serine deaminase-like pyridoxal phosphate-dependent protein